MRRAGSASAARCRASQRNPAPAQPRPGSAVEVRERGLGSQPVERLRPKIVSRISGHHAAPVLREVGLQSAVGAQEPEVKPADSDAPRVGQALPVSARMQQQRREQAAQIQQLGDALHRFQRIRKAAWPPTPPWRPEGSRSMRAVWQRCKPCTLRSMRTNNSLDPSPQ